MGRRSARAKSAAFTVLAPSASVTARGVRKSASSFTRLSPRSCVATGSWTSAAWISPESRAETRPRPPRLDTRTWATVSPARARSQPNQACSGAPGVVTPTRMADRSSIDLTVAACGAPTTRATGGAAVSPNTSRGAWVADRGPKRRTASSVVAARST